jgi:3-(3-hydroxy-phenyl)propionate hydroxylase
MPGLRVAQLGVNGFEETEGVLAGWFARHDCSAALVRPDQYVYGVASDLQMLSSQLNALAKF